MNALVIPEICNPAPSDLNLAYEIANHFTCIPEVSKIVFFGSRARGDNKSYSDYDFLFVLDEGYSWASMTAYVRRTCFNLGYRARDIDVHPTCLYQSKLLSASELHANINAEGIVLYTRTKEDITHGDLARTHS